MVQKLKTERCCAAIPTGTCSFVVFVIFLYYPYFGCPRLLLIMESICSLDFLASCYWLLLLVNDVKYWLMYPACGEASGILVYAGWYWSVPLGYWFKTATPSYSISLNQYRWRFVDLIIYWSHSPLNPKKKIEKGKK